jgi:hypothetical protein
MDEREGSRMQPPASPWGWQFRREVRGRWGRERWRGRRGGRRKSEEEDERTFFGKEKVRLAQESVRCSVCRAFP